MMLTHHVVDDPFGHARENDHHQRADNGAPERAERERRITLQVTKHAPDRFHSRAKLSQLALCNIWVDRPPSQSRSPECLCRPLNLSSAMPDLSSSPKP